MKDQRSKLMNKSLHKYCDFLSEALNENGYTVPMVLNAKALKVIDGVIQWLESIPIAPQSTKNLIINKVSSIKDALIVGGLHWTPLMVKNLIWRKVQIAMTDTYSTADISNKECKEIYDQLSQKMAEGFGLDIPWPSLESMSERQREWPKN